MDARELAWNITRVAFAVLAAVAMTYQFAKLNGNPGFSPGNFFSFFTIQSNVFAATMLVLTALVRRDERSRLFDALRGAATFYITITGVVFALLLSGLQEDLDTHIAFVNFVVHYLIPVVLVVDWFVDPPRHRLGLAGCTGVAGLPARVVRVHARAREFHRLVPVPVRRRHSARLWGRARAGGGVRARVRHRGGAVRAAQRSPLQIAPRALHLSQTQILPARILAGWRTTPHLPGMWRHDGAGRS